MNCYATLDDLRARLQITDASQDALLLDLLIGASRAVDDHCGRRFFSEVKTRILDSTSGSLLMLPDDLISVSSLTTDSEQDNTFDGETWAENTDFVLGPDTYPKWRIDTLPNGNCSFACAARYVRIVGTWGYAESANPCEATAITGTVASANGTSLTLSASGTIKAGQTLKIEDEQLFVSAVSSTTVTVRRGVNGTTAAAHDAKAIFVATYPEAVKRMTLHLATQDYNDLGSKGYDREKIGDYEYQRQNFGTRTEATTKLMDRALSAYVRTAL
jgi:hypothetical protein